MQLLICRRAWSPTGGAERYIRRLTGRLAETGIPAGLVTGTDWPEAAWGGHELIRIPGDARAFARGVVALKARRPEALFFAFDRIPGADLFRAGDGLHAAWLDRLRAEEGALADWLRRRRGRQRRLLTLERELFDTPSPPRIIANSRMVAAEIRQAFAIPADHLTVIPNGFDPPVLSDAQRAARRAAVRQALGCRPADTLALFLGSGWKRKGAQAAVDAVRSLARRDLHLALAGKGRAARTDDPRIHSVGPLADPTDHLLAADLFVLPTLYDPFSNACLEAAAFGLPVLTTDANGFAEVLTEHPAAGETIPLPREPRRWARALERWRDPERRRAAQPALAAIRKHYTVSRNQQATADFIRRCFPSA